MASPIPQESDDDFHMTCPVVAVPTLRHLNHFREVARCPCLNARLADVSGCVARHGRSSKATEECAPRHFHSHPRLSFDERQRGTALDVTFLGKLHDAQAAAVAALEPHDFGVLAATTGFGKTVVGARMIAARGLNTLVLVHRRQLVDQWRERLKAFLSIDDSSFGTIGGGKRRPSGRIDIALIQSLVRNGEVNDLVGDYGHLIVDECHHLSAVSFELVARRSKARYVLGLSATIARKGRPPSDHLHAVRLSALSC
jgi:superfamily II DNA or RNA helicase